MTTLYIAEKPDIGRSIAYHLWPQGAKKEKGYITYGDTIVTWAFGHILTFAEPKTYGPEFASWQNYFFKWTWKMALL